MAVLSNYFIINPNSFMPFLLSFHFCTTHVLIKSVNRDILRSSRIISPALSDILYKSILACARLKRNRMHPRNHPTRFSENSQRRTWSSSSGNNNNDNNWKIRYPRFKGSANNVNLCASSSTLLWPLKKIAVEFD